jgi:hypothetical protein
MGERPEILNRFEVRRLEWLRGEGDDGSKLLRSIDGMRCCLGHMARHLGASDEDIEDVASPSGALTVPWPEDMLDRSAVVLLPPDNSAFCEYLMLCNDRKGTTEAVREKSLRDAFAQIGWGVEFVG